MMISRKRALRPERGGSAKHEQWLAELTTLPTAAGREDRVVEWVRRWVRARADVRLREDRAGNLVLEVPSGGSRSRAPIWFTAHLDHPAFVVTHVIDGRRVKLEFRGGVHPPYFERARIDIVDSSDGTHAARITRLERASPFNTVHADVDGGTERLDAGDIGRCRFEEGGALPRVDRGVFHTHACDDLAAVAAALSAFDVLRRR